MEGVGGIDPAFWAGRRVFLTGHTGFKGSWLALWLHRLGAEVHGYALAPDTSPSLFEMLGLADTIAHRTADVRDADGLAWAMQSAAPQLVLHLAAQPIVRASYDDPIATWATNVTGTINVLEAARRCEDLEAVVTITTDKVYENPEDGRAFQESDPLGGYDPYSSSKAAAEIACASWRRSFLQEQGVAVATARAGNVLGGGDWAADRLIPDAMRAFADGRPVVLRNPAATRPWQHVLEPLRGYLLLAQACVADPSRFARAFNFGPKSADVVPVRAVIGGLAERWGGEATWELHPDAAAQPHEAQTLTLDWSLARTELQWSPNTSLDRCLDLTAAWYRGVAEGGDARAICEAQLTAVCEAEPA